MVHERIYCIRGVTVVRPRAGSGSPSVGTPLKENGIILNDLTVFEYRTSVEQQGLITSL